MASDLSVEVQNLRKQKEFLEKMLKNKTPGVDRSSLNQLYQETCQKLALTEMVEEAVQDEPVERFQPPPLPTSHAVVSAIEAVDYQRLCHDCEFFISHLSIKYRPGLNKDYPKGGRGRFILTETQRMLVRLIVKIAFIDCQPVRLIILKSRQLGCTTLIEAIKLWLTLTRPNFTSFFIIDKDNHLITKREIMLEWIEQCKQMFPKLPTLKKGGKKAKLLFFTNNSNILMDSALSPNPGTSEQIGWCNTSEETKWPASRPEQVKSSIIPTIPETDGTFVIRESTAEGVGAFYQDWMTAKKGGSYLPVFIAWYVSPECATSPPMGFMASTELDEYSDFDSDLDREMTEREYQLKYSLSDAQIYWRRQKIGSFDGNRSHFDQEYPTTDEHAFRMFQSSFFSRRTLDKAFSGICDPVAVGNLYDEASQPELCHFSLLKPIFRMEPSGPLQVWEKPQPGKKYYIGVDVAEGLTTETTDGQTESDWTVITIIDDDGKTVAKYRSKEYPEDTWLPLSLLGVWYNLAVINGETNTAGPLLYKMQRSLYPELLILPEPKYRPVVERTWVRTNPASRKLMLQNTRMLYNEHPEYVVSELLYGELVTFIVNKNGKPCAAPGFHDDDLLSSAIAEHCRRISKGLIHFTEEPAQEIEPEIVIKYPEDGITILDTDDPWLASFI